jgi:hypothetical protein
MTPVRVVRADRPAPGQRHGRSWPVEWQHDWDGTYRQPCYQEQAQIQQLAQEAM